MTNAISPPAAILLATDLSARCDRAGAVRAEVTLD